ncbi:MAG TPA: NAD(P)-dependent oxidoreductase [Frankiaceae bacterium]|nr:NAD(P)-dependent oxidoreductase [Frankiaceae bacterium]
MKIAYLGMGRMGRLTAAHILSAGHELTVWNRTPGKANELIERGAREAPDIEAAVNGADAVVLMLFGPESVEAVLEPIAAGAPAGTLVIDNTTTGPDASRHLGEKAHALGLRYVDAPVVGSLQPAPDGTLGIVVGGSNADVAAARPLLELWGAPDRIRHLGPVGAGNALKSVINMCLGIAMAGVGEAMRLGVALNIPEGIVLDALEAGPFGFSVTQKREMLASGDFHPTTFSLDLMAKDLQVALEAAGDAAGELPVLRDSLELARGASGAGHGDDDYAAMGGYRARGLLR